MNDKLTFVEELEFKVIAGGVEMLEARKAITVLQEMMIGEPIEATIEHRGDKGRGSKPRTWVLDKDLYPFLYWDGCHGLDGQKVMVCVFGRKGKRD